MARHQMATQLRNRRALLVLLVLCLATNARWAAAQAALGFPQNNILVSEAGVAASSLIQSGRVYAEIDGPAQVNTGLAIANPNSHPATVSFYFVWEHDGDPFDRGSMTIPPNGQVSKFLDESPFNGPSPSGPLVPFHGTFTFSSSVPIAVIALRMVTNERGEFLMTTLPVVDLSAPSPAGSIAIPQFANGGGWKTQIVLVSTSVVGAQQGTVQFFDPSGLPAMVAPPRYGAPGGISSVFPYSVSRGSSDTFETSGAGAAVTVGSVRVIPNTNSTAPSALVIFSFHIGGVP
jgi:hypothetical protein